MTHSIPDARRDSCHRLFIPDNKEFVMPTGSADIDTINSFVKLGGGILGGIGAILTVVSMLGLA